MLGPTFSIGLEAIFEMLANFFCDFVEAFYAYTKSADFGGSLALDSDST